MIRREILIALAAAIAPGCAYLRDRGRDAARILEFDAGLSSGFGAHVGLTGVLEAGASWYSGRRFGLREGSFVTLNEERSELGVPILYMLEVRQDVIGGSMPGRDLVGILDPGHERYPLQWFSGQLTDRDPLDFHVGFNAVVAGLNFSFRSYAFVDFVVGWVGLDPRRNDLAGLTENDLIPDLESSDALARRRAVSLLQDLTGRTWRDYRTPPKRDLFLTSEQAAISEIERELISGTGGDPSRQVHPAADAVDLRVYGPARLEPMRAEPASRARAESP